MEYFLGGLAFVVIIALLSWGAGRSRKSADSKKEPPKVKAANPIKCPVCGSELFVGENIISKVYRPMNVPDQLMSVMGCPHCYPKCEPGVRRFCPVCHQQLGQDEVLTARLFNKAVGKKHVHVVGCSRCHKVDGR